jgi:PqqD family protein of HPr-rel-A system
MASVWRVPEPSGLHWRDWDGEHVVYHEASGDTHRFNDVGALALRLLADRPRTAAHLVDELTSRTPGADRATLGQTVDELIARLCDLGLIEPQDDSPGARPV